MHPTLRSARLATGALLLLVAANAIATTSDARLHEAVRKANAEVG